MQTEENKIEFPEFGELPKDEYAFSDSDSNEGRLKDRVLLKKMVNVHKFTYQDIVNMIAQSEAALKNIDKEEARMKADREETKGRLALWQKQREEIEAAFPEIVAEEEALKAEAKEAEAVPSPVVMDSPEDIEGIQE